MSSPRGVIVTPQHRVQARGGSVRARAVQIHLEIEYLRVAALVD